MFRDVIVIVMVCCCFAFNILASTNGQPISLDDAITSVQNAANNLENYDDSDDLLTWLHDNAPEALDLAKSIGVTNIQKWLMVEDKTQKKIEELRLLQTEENQSSANKAKLDTAITVNLQMLTNVQNKLALLKLSPTDRIKLEEYNRTIVHEQTFGEWISEPITWWDTGRDVIIALFFFWLGMRWDEYQERRKRKHRSGKQSVC